MPSIHKQRRNQGSVCASFLLLLCVQPRLLLLLFPITFPKLLLLFMLFIHQINTQSCFFITHHFPRHLSDTHPLLPTHSHTYTHTHTDKSKTKNNGPPLRFPHHHFPPPCLLYPLPCPGPRKMAWLVHLPCSRHHTHHRPCLGCGWSVCLCGWVGGAGVWGVY